MRDSSPQILSFYPILQCLEREGDVGRGRLCSQWSEKKAEKFPGHLYVSTEKDSPHPFRHSRDSA